MGPHAARLAPLRLARLTAAAPLSPPPPARPLLQPRQRRAALGVVLAAPSAEAAPDEGGPKAQGGAASAKAGSNGLADMLSPLSNPAANAKLLAISTGGHGTCSKYPRTLRLGSRADLTGPQLLYVGDTCSMHAQLPSTHVPAALPPHVLLAAQCLSSIATLLHDTYLPLFMSEVLGMSNTKVCSLPCAVRLPGEGRRFCAPLSSGWLTAGQTATGRRAGQASALLHAAGRADLGLRDAASSQACRWATCTACYSS